MVPTILTGKKKSTWELHAYIKIDTRKEVNLALLQDQTWEQEYLCLKLQDPGPSHGKIHDS